MLAMLPLVLVLLISAFLLLLSMTYSHRASSPRFKKLRVAFTPPRPVKREIAPAPPVARGVFFSSGSSATSIVRARQRRLSRLFEGRALPPSGRGTAWRRPE